MGLIFFNLMILTVFLTAVIMLVFGIIFIKNRKLGKENNIKRSTGTSLTVAGAILSPIFFFLVIFFLIREAEYGANTIGNGALLLGSLFIWPIVLFVDASVIFFYVYTGVHFMKMGKNKKTKEIVAIDHYVLGLLLIILGITYILSAIGATVLPPSFVD